MVHFVECEELLPVNILNTAPATWHSCQKLSEDSATGELVEKESCDLRYGSYETHINSVLQ